MPLYEFECNNCKTKIEKLMKFSDPKPIHCEVCNTDNLKQVVSQNTGFLLKGAGWERPGLRCKSNR